MPVYPEMYGQYLRIALQSDMPSIIFEPRRLYEAEPKDMNTGSPDFYLLTYGDTVIDAFEAATILGEQGIVAYVLPLENVSWVMSIPDAKNQLTIDMAPRHPEPGLLAPPFMPQGVSQPLAKAWYITANDIVDRVCEMLGKKPPEYKEEDADYAPAGSSF